MKRLATCSILLILLAAAAVTGAAPFDAATRAKAIAPAVEEGTAVVVHIDLSRIAPRPLLDFLGPLRLVSPLEMWSGQTDAFLRAGGSEIYLLASVGVFATDKSRMRMAVPVSSGEQEAAFRAALRLRPEEGRRYGSLLVIGDRTPLPREFRPVERPELAAAFGAAGDTAAQTILIPPACTQRVVDELWPQLPKQLGGGPSSVFTRGVRWAAVGIDVSPRQAFRMVIQSDDASTAEALREKLAELLRLAGQQKEVRRQVPEFEAVAALLTPKVEGDRLMVAADEKMETFSKALAALMRPLLIAEARAASVNNLKEIALAMHNYYSANKHFPPPVLNGPDGKTTYSWRVAILPYMDRQMDLFRQYRFDEPWDGPHNRQLIDQMPAVYRLPLSGTKEPGRTNYLLPVGNGAGFTMDKPTEFKDIRDGTSMTIMVVEVDDQHATVWTKPDDWPFNPKEPAKGLGRFFDGGFNAAFFDGSVTTFRAGLDMKTLHGLLTRAGGEVVER